MSSHEKVQAVIAEVLELPPSDVRPESRFIEDLGANSLDIVGLIMRVEEVFGLSETPDSRLEQIRTVSDLCELVDELRPERDSEVHQHYDVAVGSDHAGVELKARLTHWLKEHGYRAIDLGPNETHAVDYPDFARLVAERIASGEAAKGVLICGSGVGMSIAANKVNGVRAALVFDALTAELARKHNDANVICLGARLVGDLQAERCVEAFLATSFDPGDDGRHRRRVQLIEDIASARAPLEQAE